MKRIFQLLIVLTLVFTLSACSKGYTDIDNDQLRDMLENNTDYYFIDVRTAEEYAVERIPGFTKNIDYYYFEDDFDMLDDLKTDRPVVLMCNSGRRSASAARIFLKIGFTEVYNLKDGIQGWDGETE